MKKILFVVVLVALILLAPLGVKKYINSSLEKTKDDLNNTGIEFKILSNKGYFQSNREYELRINNIAKLQKDIKERLYKIDPIVKRYIQRIDLTKQRGIEEVKNIILKGNIKNSNIIPFSKIHSTMYISSLPKMMSRDKKVKTFIENKTIFLNITSSFSGKLEKIDLKDIKDEGKLTLSDFLGISFTNKSDDKNIAGDLFIDRIALTSKVNHPSDSASIDKFDYDFKYTDYWTNSLNSKVQKIAIGKDFTIEELVNNAHGEIKGDDYLGGITLKMKKFDLKSKRRLPINISNLDFDMDMKLSKQYLKDMNKLYYQSLLSGVFGRGMYSNKYLLMSMLNDPNFIIKGLNHGLSFKTDLTFEEFKSPMVTLTSPKLDISIKLDKNDLNASNISKDLLKFLNLNLNLKIKEDEYKNLATLLRLNKLNEYVKFENKQAIVKIETLNNQINVNGKVINLPR